MSQTNFRPVRDQIEASRAAAPKNLQVPIEDGNYGMLLVFKDYFYRQPGSSAGRFVQLSERNVGDTIFLPLPENIADSFTVRVQRFDQGSGAGAQFSDIVSNAMSSGGLRLSTFQDAAIAAVEEALPKAATDGEEFKNLLVSAFNSLISEDSDLSSIDRFSSDAAFLIRKFLPGNVGRNFDAGAGTFLNPKATLSFEGVELKTHNFNWTVAPKSPPESENLREVIRTIKKNILPQYIEGGEISQRAMFRYPSMVDIFFIGIDDNYYYKFKTAMVQTFNVNYTPNGVSVLKGGRPAAVQMQMGLMESDIHTSEDYGGESFRLDFGEEFRSDVRSLLPTSSGQPTVQ